MRHNSSVLFHLNLYMLSAKGANEDANFQTFKSRFSFPLNFASPFTVITYNFSEVFQLKHYILWTKRAHQYTILNIQSFRLLSALMKVHPIPHATFETARSGFIQVLHHCSVSWKITPLNVLAQTLYTLDKNSPSKWNVQTFQW